MEYTAKTILALSQLVKNSVTTGIDFLLLRLCIHEYVNWLSILKI